VSSGWHPWYELKVDPEDSNNLIICGTKWDAAQNSPFGFVYASSDGGQTWGMALSDRSSTWVTEHSCAFGAKHTAFFVSEASHVIGGRPHHEFGRTRIFTSLDAGQHWTEAAATGWADYSTSAVSSKSSRLYTFFNSFDTTRDPGKSWGSTVGLLVFTPNQKTVHGPFFDPAMQAKNYRGAFPSNAVALKSGAVAALFYGRRPADDGGEADLGIIRADQSDEPVLRQTIVAHLAVNLAGGCDTLSDNSLAYDHEHDRLFLLYVDGCDHRDQFRLTSSDDEGRTWAESVIVRDLPGTTQILSNPSLVVRSSGSLGLVWQQRETSGSRRWLFSTIRKFRFDHTIELPSGPEKPGINIDSLRSAVTPADEQTGANETPSLGPGISIEVMSNAGVIWRSSGAIAKGDQVFAVWSADDDHGTRLDSENIAEKTLDRAKTSGAVGRTSDTDVTRDTSFLYGYGGAQHFDRSTGVLRLCLSLANRGNKSIKLPIKVKVEGVSSSVGAVSILNASNGLTGNGAQWDMSSSVTGDQVPPQTNTHPFCFLFHIDGERSGASVVDLLQIKVRVLARTGHPGR
jgi:hypothetical protein